MMIFVDGGMIFGKLKGKFRVVSLTTLGGDLSKTSKWAKWGKNNDKLVANISYPGHLLVSQKSNHPPSHHYLKNPTPHFPIPNFCKYKYPLYTFNL